MSLAVEAINKKIALSDKKLFKIFDIPTFTEEDLQKYREAMGKLSYMVAITPRSGSSYFCDLLAKTGKLGKPSEWINSNLMPGMIKTRPANNVVQHITNMRNLTSKPDGVFGIKASFFQYSPIIDTGLDQLLFDQFKIIKLFRKNILLQAISLYIATETDVFHTNIQHDMIKLSKIDSFEYDNEKLWEWIRHIYKQEVEWIKYLAGRSHMTIYYEDLINDVPAHIKKVSDYLGIIIEQEINPEDSVFKKLGFDRSESIYNQFINNNKNVDFMGELGISSDRYTL